VLGVVINDRLSTDSHVTATITACQSLCTHCEYYVAYTRNANSSTSYCTPSNCMWCQSWYTAVRLGRASAVSKTEIGSTPSSSRVNAAATAPTEWTSTVDKLNRPVSTSPVIKACSRLIHYDVKISSARIRTHDLWIRKRVCYPQVLANSNHTLHQCIPQISNHDHHLRTRPYNHQLPAKRTNSQTLLFIRYMTLFKSLNKFKCSLSADYVSVYCYKC